MSQVIRIKEVLAMTGLSRSTIWRLQQNGGFPSPIKLSVQAVAWFESDVTEWLKNRPRTTMHLIERKG